MAENFPEVPDSLEGIDKIYPFGEEPFTSADAASDMLSLGYVGDAERMLVGPSEYREPEYVGVVNVSDAALRTALGYIRYEKEQALDEQNHEAAAEWRDQEKHIISALGGLGLARPD